MITDRLGQTLVPERVTGLLRTSSTAVTASSARARAWTLARGRSSAWTATAGAEAGPAAGGSHTDSFDLAIIVVADLEFYLPPLILQGKSNRKSNG